MPSTAAGTSASVGNNGTTNFTINAGSPTYALLKIQVSVSSGNCSSWLRLYTDTSSQSADSGRIKEIEPDPEGGVIAETILSTSSSSVTTVMVPGVIGFNSAGTSNLVYCTLTNLSGATKAFTVTLTVVGLEN